ncbi:MAG: peptidoglycan-binding domain-containing protein, partial [bacterium]
NTKIGEFTEEVENAVIQFQRNNNLPETGAMDDDTLTLLIWNIDPLELDRTNPIVHEKPETFPDMAYIPTDGGKKHHSNPLCSDMYDPRKVSIRNAIKMGFEACGKCMKREKWLH